VAGPAELVVMAANDRPKRVNLPQRQVLEALSQVAVNQMKEMRSLAEELARRQQEGIRLAIQIQHEFEEFARVTGLDADDLIVDRDGKLHVLGEDP
jgi:hypothetical protein